jgi:hypothetical protein
VGSVPEADDGLPIWGRLASEVLDALPVTA